MKIHPPHAIDFIKYAATVQGNYEVAIKAAKDMEAPWIRIILEL